MPEYTTTDAAEMLGVNRRNVQNYCKRHGLKKFGREYIVTDVDLAGMKQELGKVGRKARPIGSVIGSEPQPGADQGNEQRD